MSRPFDIALWKQGHPVMTRDGVPVPNDCIAHMPGAPESDCIVYWVNGEIFPVSSTGIYFKKSKWDLVMAPTKRTVWVNLYPPETVAKWFVLESAADEDAERLRHFGHNYNRLGGRAYPVEVDADE